MPLQSSPHKLQLLAIYLNNIELPTTHRPYCLIEVGDS